MSRDQNDAPTSDYASSGDADQPSGSGVSGSGGAVSRSGSNLTGCLKGDYQILRRIGRGGMADVYVAQQKSLDRQVAIKVLRSDLAKDANYVERFRREAKSVAKLSHSCIVQVYEVGQWDDQHYIVQEFVDGKNLRQQLEHSGPLSVEMAVAVLAGVTDALQAAHNAGITHRDIKPENIMLSSVSGNRRESSQENDAKSDTANHQLVSDLVSDHESYHVKVADFGLARVAQQEGVNDLTQVGLTMGTPRYMSPEQLQGKPVRIQSDLYSLGVTMFHLLTGRPPFEADDPLAMAVKHLQEKPPSLVEARGQGDLPPWLVQIIERLMEKSPENRFQGPHELGEAIRRGIAKESPHLATSTTGNRISAELALQRAMNRQSQRLGKKSIWTTAVWLLPAVGLMAGGALMARQERVSVASLLESGPTSVERQASVEGQYLEAARRDQPHAWKAVWEYFPPQESNVNAEYAAKARLQLARYYAGNRQPEESQRVVEELLADGELDKLYRALALVQLIEVLEGEQRKQESAERRDELSKLYQDLQLRHPTKRELFDDIAPRAEVLRLQAD
jgi:eukaryotic-like serine/threonine-protein kinase